MCPGSNRSSPMPRCPASAEVEAHVCGLTASMGSTWSMPRRGPTPASSTRGGQAGGDCPSVRLGAGETAAFTISTWSGLAVVFRKRGACLPGWLRGGRPGDRGSGLDRLAPAAQPLCRLDLLWMVSLRLTLPVQAFRRGRYRGVQLATDNGKAICWRRHWLAARPVRHRTDCWIAVRH